MENITGATPTIDWESKDLEGAWKRFQTHINFMFSGPLKKKTEEEKCSYLMLWVGEKGRNIYSTWNLSEEDSKKLESYTNGFQNYVKPRTNTVYNRFVFQTRSQKPDETFDQFCTELKLLVKDCTYDKNDEMVRDRIVAGVSNAKLRDKLLNIGSDLTLEKAIETARTHEISKQQNKIMSGEKPVNLVKSKQKIQYKPREEPRAHASRGEMCQRCGKVHGKNDCKALGQICRKCNKANHFAAMCKSKPQTGKSFHQTGKTFKPKQSHPKYKNRVHTVEYTDDSSDKELFVGILYEQNVNTVSPEWTIESQINNKVIPMHVDSGARCNVISEETLKYIDIKTALSKSEIRLKSFSGHTLKSKGTVVLPCTITGFSLRGGRRPN